MFWCFYLHLLRFIKKLSFLYQTLLNLPLKKNSSFIIVGFLFSFKLQILRNYRYRCVSIRFLERIDSYPIRLVSLSESERSNPSPLRKLWLRFQFKISINEKIPGKSEIWRNDSLEIQVTPNIKILSVPERKEGKRHEMLIFSSPC